MKWRRRSLLALPMIVVAISLASTASARADDPTPSPPPASPTPSDALAEEARTRIRRGLELYDEGDYKLALIELERAYEILPSYKILYNIGQIHYQLGQYSRAHATLTRYLTEGANEIPADRRADVEADLAALVKRIATLTVEVNIDGVEVMFDDQPVGTIGSVRIERRRVDAGSIRVIVSKPGYTTKTRIVTLAGGDEIVVRFDLAKAMPLDALPPPPPPPPTLSKLELGSWIATGVLAVGAIGTGIATSAAASRFDTLREAPIQGSAAQAKADLDRQGNLVDALAITTDVLIVSAIVAGGISLYLTFGRSKSAPAAPPRAAMLTF